MKLATSRVMLASSYPSVRDALSTYLMTDPSIDVVAEADSVDGMATAVIEHKPDVVIVENMAGLAAPRDVAELLAEQGLSTPIIYLGMSPDKCIGATTAAATCNDFLPLELAPRDLFDVVWSATLRGRGHGADFSAACSPKTSAPPSSVSRAQQPLSRGETYLLRRLVKGETPDTLSAALGLPAASLEAYRRRIITRLSGLATATFAAASCIPA